MSTLAERSELVAKAEQYMRDNPELYRLGEKAFDVAMEKVGGVSYGRAENPTSELNAIDNQIYRLRMALLDEKMNYARGAPSADLGTISAALDAALAALSGAPGGLSGSEQQRFERARQEAEAEYARARRR